MLSALVYPENICWDTCNNNTKNESEIVTMNSDHKIINSLMELECGKNRKILDLFRGDWEELSQKQELNSFVRVCKKLAS